MKACSYSDKLLIDLEITKEYETIIKLNTHTHKKKNNLKRMPIVNNNTMNSFTDKKVSLGNLSSKNRPTLLSSLNKSVELPLNSNQAVNSSVNEIDIKKEKTFLDNEHPESGNEIKTSLIEKKLTKSSIDFDTKNFKEKLAHFEELSKFLLARNKGVNVSSNNDVPKQFAEINFDKATSITGFLTQVKKSTRFTFVNDPNSESFFKKVASFSIRTQALNFCE